MYKIELIKYPTQEDLLWCKKCCLNTVGKNTATAPTEEWIEKLVEAEHSPMRELWFGVRMEIPYWVSVHFVRHHIGVNHYVQTQRNDRQNKYDREQAPQGEIVSHIMSLNAQELVFMAHKRLCSQASPETREVMQGICNEVIKVAPYMKKVLVPLCVYRGGKCTEFTPCGRAKKQKEQDNFLLDHYSEYQNLNTNFLELGDYISKVNSIDNYTLPNDYDNIISKINSVDYYDLTNDYMSINNKEKK